MQKSDAIEHFGNASKLAKALGLSRQAVYAWKDGEIPELYQYKLHHMTGGELPLSPNLEPEAKGK